MQPTVPVGTRSYGRPLQRWLLSFPRRNVRGRDGCADPFSWFVSSFGHVSPLWQVRQPCRSSAGPVRACRSKLRVRRVGRTDKTSTRAQHGLSRGKVLRFSCQRTKAMKCRVRRKGRGAGDSALKPQGPLPPRRTRRSSASARRAPSYCTEIVGRGGSFLRRFVQFREILDSLSAEATSATRGVRNCSRSVRTRGLSPQLFVLVRSAMAEAIRPAEYEYSTVHHDMSGARQTGTACEVLPQDLAVPLVFR